MAKIRLIIADPDEGYVLGLSDFISSFYSHKFDVHTFTEYDSISQFVAIKKSSFDILLISPEFYIENVGLVEAGKLVLLGPVGITQKLEGLKIINRYQHAEKLIGNISEILSENKQIQFSVHAGRKTSRITGICSAGGGTGKTAISLGCSIQTALLGHKVLYLNLETINSVNFLEYDKKRSISKVLFYLREKNKALPLKIEGIRCIDKNYGIHYFSPLDSPLDLEDITAEEYELLISTVRAMGEYDFVFIDLPHGLSRINTEILSSCDHVLLITEYNTTLHYRFNTMIDHIKNMSYMLECNILDKSISVLNKYDQQLYSEANGISNETDSFMKIPYVPEGRCGGIEACLQSKAFLQGTNKILDFLIKG